MAKKVATPIGEEILGVVSVKRGKRDGDQDYLAKIARACDAMSEADWDNLSEDAQEWVNGALKAINDESEIDALPGVELTDEPAEEEAEKPAPAKKSAKKAASKKAADSDEEEAEEEEAEEPAKKPAAKKAAKKADKAPAKKSGKGSAMLTFKTLVCEHRDEPLEDILARLGKKGMSVGDSTAATTYHGTRQVLKILDSLGMLKG